MNYLGCPVGCPGCDYSGVSGLNGLEEFGLGAAKTREQRQAEAAERQRLARERQAQRRSTALARREVRQQTQAQRRAEAQQRQQSRKETQRGRVEARKEAAAARKEARIQKRLANGKVALVDPKESATVDKMNAQLASAKKKNTELREKFRALKQKPPRRKVLRKRGGVSGMGLFGLGEGEDASSADYQRMIYEQQRMAAAAKQQAAMEKVCRNPASMKCLVLTLSQQTQQQMEMMMALMQEIMDQNARLEEQILDLMKQGYGGGDTFVDENGNPVDANGNPIGGGGGLSPQFVDSNGYPIDPNYYQPQGGSSYQGPQYYPGEGGGGFQPAPIHYDEQQYDDPYYEGGEIRGDAVPVSLTPNNAGPYPINSGFIPMNLEVSASFNDAGDQSDGFDVGVVNAGLPIVENYDAAEGYAEDYGDVGDPSGLFGHSRE